jgi:hypothetical protein
MKGVRVDELMDMLRRRRIENLIVMLESRLHLPEEEQIDVNHVKSSGGIETDLLTIALLGSNERLLKVLFIQPDLNLNRELKINVSAFSIACRTSVDIGIFFDFVNDYRFTGLAQPIDLKENALTFLNNIIFCMHASNPNCNSKLMYAKKIWAILGSGRQCGDVTLDIKYAIEPNSIRAKTYYAMTLPRAKASYYCRKQLELPNIPSTRLFILLVCLVDDYFTFMGTSGQWHQFLAITKCLPSELQQLMCNRVYGDPSDVIKPEIVRQQLKKMIVEGVIKI